jgi:hypothetical protein
MAGALENAEADQKWMDASKQGANSTDRGENYLISLKL